MTPDVPFSSVSIIKHNSQMISTISNEQKFRKLLPAMYSPGWAGRLITLPFETKGIIIGEAFRCWFTRWMYDILLGNQAGSKPPIGQEGCSKGGTHLAVDQLDSCSIVNKGNNRQTERYLLSKRFISPVMIS